MAIYPCKIHVGNIIYTANITKDLIDDVIANEETSWDLEMLEQANIDKTFRYKLYNKKVELISYEPIGMDKEMENDNDVNIPEVHDPTENMTQGKYFVET